MAIFFTFPRRIPLFALLLCSFAYAQISPERDTKYINTLTAEFMSSLNMLLSNEFKEKEIVQMRENLSDYISDVSQIQDECGGEYLDKKGFFSYIQRIKEKSSGDCIFKYVFEVYPLQMENDTNYYYIEGKKTIYFGATMVYHANTRMTYYYDKELDRLKIIRLEDDSVIVNTFRSVICPPPPKKRIETSKPSIPLKPVHPLIPSLALGSIGGAALSTSLFYFVPTRNKCIKEYKNFPQIVSVSDSTAKANLYDKIYKNHTYALVTGIGSAVLIAGGVGAYFYCRKERKKYEKKYQTFLLPIINPHSVSVAFMYQF